MSTVDESEFASDEAMFGPQDADLGSTDDGTPHQCTTENGA